MPDIYQTLEQLQIPYTKHEHPAVFTCEEADQHYHNLPGGKNKNLFLRNKKGDQHYLVSISSDKRADLKHLVKILQESKLSFGSPERLEKHLGLTPGSVSPFGLINDTDKHVIVVIDNDLWQNDILHYHPNINTATLQLKRDDFQKFLNHTGHKVIFADL